MSAPKTHRKDGTPTAYGFACGYGIMRQQDNPTAPPVEQKSVTLYLNHGNFDIKSIDWSKNTANAAAWAANSGWNDPFDFRKWKTATTIHEARRIFRMECKRLGLKATP